MTMDLAKVIEVGGSVIKGIIGDEKAQKFICGTYADGTPRNVFDAVNEEFLSPKQKNKLRKKKKKKKKKKPAKLVL